MKHLLQFILILVTLIFSVVTHLWHSLDMQPAHILHCKTQMQMSQC